MVDTTKYPIGEQDFKSLREMDCVYVDKTQYIRRLIDSGSKYYFLARPRRFGKSLFLSTLRYFFEGKRTLFHGLNINDMVWDWEEYPVLRLDLNPNRYNELEDLYSVLDYIFRDWEKKYDVEVKDTSYPQRFATIIKTAHEKTGKQVVVLVDEYDKPLVSNLQSDEKFEIFRRELASIYGNFKSAAEHIRMVFLTGVSRFSKLSVFSDLNNLNDITFENDYSAICGITETELLSYFKQGIEKLADEYEISVEEAIAKLKKNYDGYRFAPKGMEIYNPWSLLNCLSKSMISNYWSQTGKPTLIAESLKRVDADLEQILTSRCQLSALAGMDLMSADPIALLYQSGYLTIKDFNHRRNQATLGIPNIEVKESLFQDLLPYYVSLKHGYSQGVVFDIIDEIEEGNPDKLVKNLNIFLSSIPYEMKMEDENNFHNALYILLTLIGIRVSTEVHTSDGRIDLVISTPQFVYIIELKFDKSSEIALAQIEEKEYVIPFLRDHRNLFLIGLNFDSSTRRLCDPIIKEWEK